MIITGLLFEYFQLPRTVYTALYVIWIVASTAFLLNRTRRPITTLAWLLGFWSLPIPSVLLYFFIGPRKLEGLKRHRKAVHKAVSAYLPGMANDPPEAFSSSNSDWISLARVTQSSGVASPQPSRASSITQFKDGDEAYPAIERAMSEARSSVHLEYYIYEPDVIGTRWRDLLIKLSNRGVRVRLVVDAIGAQACDAKFWQPLLDAEAEVRIFNPVRVSTPKPGSINFRSHRKIVVVDGRTVFSGGINVSDNNTADPSVDKLAWRNTHLEISGPPVREYQATFLEDWLYAVPVNSKAEKRKWMKTRYRDVGELSMPRDVDSWFPHFKTTTGPWVQVVQSGPEESTHDVHRLFFAAINTARKRVWITTPYFIPDEPIQTAILSAVARGIDVRLIVPEHGDSKLVQVAANTYARDVAEEGASVSLYQPCMNHSKSLIIDDDITIIGTANMDNRSFRLNFEICAVVFDKSFTTEAANLFEEDLAHCVYMDIEVESSFLERIYSNAVRLLSPLL